MLVKNPLTTVLTLLFYSVFLNAPVHATPSSSAIVTQNKTATETGLAILAKGGNAAEAAIAAAFSLGVNEPHNSGIGGGGFLLYYDKAQNTLTFVDYREAAPLATKVADYKKPETSLTGGLAIAVPGLVAGLKKIHERFGDKITWQELLDPAIKQAKTGFIPGEIIHQRFAQEYKRLTEQKDFQSVFGGLAQTSKSPIKQENLALTLEKIASGGAKDFYHGALAKILVKELENAGSLITLEDLARYTVYFTKPHSFIFKDYTIHSAPLPSTGGLLLQQLLGSARDRGITTKDENFNSFLATELARYFENRKKLGDKRTNPFASTSHISVVDAQGNIASMTNTLNSPFGSAVVLPGLGILMNNEMDDFDFEDPEISRNLPERGNRPLSSMSPTIIFKGLEPALVIGTPGGLTIPINIYQVLQRHLIEGENLGVAIKAPKIYFLHSANKALYESGYKITPIMNGPRPVLSEKPIGNIQAIRIDKSKLTTFSDPRGEGIGSKYTH